jgi:hypothetical protein
MPTDKKVVKYIVRIVIDVNGQNQYGDSIDDSHITLTRVLVEPKLSDIVKRFEEA